MNGLGEENWVRLGGTKRGVGSVLADPSPSTDRQLARLRGPSVVTRGL